MISSLGRAARSGKRVELISGAKERPSRRGSVRCASASTGRWVCTGGEGSRVFQLRGMTLGTRHVHRARLESGALVFSSVGKDLQRRAEAGLIDVWEEMSLRAAIRLLCGRSTVSGERHDSAVRIGTRVDQKQLVIHLCTCHQ